MNLRIDRAGMLVCAGLVMLAAGSRLMDIAPNFTAVAAVAMFAGFLFRDRAAAAGVVVLAMLLSDAIIGFYDPRVMLAVYGSMAAAVFLGRALKKGPGPVPVLGASLAASILFFIVTNFAVWAAGWYPPTAEGLIASYAAAIPFFKYTLTGDLLFSAALFGSYSLVRAGLFSQIRGAIPAAV